MPDIGWSELALVAAVAVMVVGPRELPRALRTVMGLARHARRMGAEVTAQLEAVARAADVEDIRRAANPPAMAGDNASADASGPRQPPAADTARRS